MTMSKELLEKAKAVNSAEELLALAKENNVELTEESSKAYFELVQAQSKNGELSDEELDNVSGGGCHASDGRLVTTVANSCKHWRYKRCWWTSLTRFDDCPSHSISHTNDLCKSYFMVSHICDTCMHCTYEDALWLCNHPANKG
ncbi:MAG: hypothetical protein J6S14_08085 [Clostridia bacterium]|nr:hypothetical protein [Clostridia bacterium]